MHQRSATLLVWLSENGSIPCTGYLVPGVPGLALRELRGPNWEEPRSLFSIVHMSTGRSLFNLPIEFGMVDQADQVAQWFHDQAVAAGFTWDIDKDGLLRHKEAVLSILNQAQALFFIAPATAENLKKSLKN